MMTSDETAHAHSELQEEYAQNELDNDRNPTEQGFIEWLVRRVWSSRSDT